MNVEELLSRLEKVRQVNGRRQWSARCPAHSDRTPSLAVAVTNQDQILIHCRAGCDPLSVVHAVGMTLADLYPERLGDRIGPMWWAKPKDMHRDRQAAKYLVGYYTDKRDRGEKLSRREKDDEYRAWKLSRGK